MIKEIRISTDEIFALTPGDYPRWVMLKNKGFPMTDNLFYPQPKAGLMYYEFHDHKTGEIVVQFEDIE